MMMATWCEKVLLMGLRVVTFKSGVALVLDRGKQQMGRGVRDLFSGEDVAGVFYGVRTVRKRE